MAQERRRSAPLSRREAAIWVSALAPISLAIGSSLRRGRRWKCAVRAPLNSFLVWLKVPLSATIGIPTKTHGERKQPAFPGQRAHAMSILMGDVSWTRMIIYRRRAF